MVKFSVYLNRLVYVTGELLMIAKDAKCLHADNEDRSDCADARADLSLRLAHISDGMFSHVVVQMAMAVSVCLNIPMCDKQCIT